MFEETEVWERGLSQKHLYWIKREQPESRGGEGRGTPGNKRNAQSREEKSEEGTFRTTSQGVFAQSGEAPESRPKRMDHRGIPHLWVATPVVEPHNPNLPCVLP